MVQIFGSGSMKYFSTVFVLSMVDGLFYVAKICFAADPVHSSALLNFLQQDSCCFSNLVMCLWPSTIANVLTMYKYHIQLLFKQAESLQNETV